MKIIDLDEIYNFLVLSFSFEVIKMLKKLMTYLDLRVFSTFHTYSLTALKPKLTAGHKKVKAVTLKTAELFQRHTEYYDLF